jgi:hypothetical protein
MNAGMRAAEKKQMEQQTALGRLGTAEDSPTRQRSWRPTTLAR